MYLGKSSLQLNKLYIMYCHYLERETAHCSSGLLCDFIINQLIKW